jgi:hypothetical protein
MLPESDDFPAHISQFPEILSIALSVLPNFLLPEIRNSIFPGREPVSMPEITVNENGDFGLCESNVGAAG